MPKRSVHHQTCTAWVHEEAAAAAGAATVQGKEGREVGIGICSLLRVYAFNSLCGDLLSAEAVSQACRKDGLWEPCIY